MASKKFKVDYSKFKDADLVAEMRSRGQVTPLSEDGHVMRGETIMRLMEMDELAAKNDITEKVRVIFHNSNNPSAGPYVFASINEKNFQAPYEKEVVIPRYFLTECIDRARTVVYEQIQTPGVRGSEPKYIPTYPYTILGPAVEEDDDNNVAA